ncbi:MAG: hypothetical protein ACRD3W_14220, partial [Terriglobales bacterium]
AQRGLGGLNFPTYSIPRLKLPALDRQRLISYKPRPCPGSALPKTFRMAAPAANYLKGPGSSVGRAAD